MPHLYLTTALLLFWPLYDTGPLPEKPAAESSLPVIQTSCVFVSYSDGDIASGPQQQLFLTFDAQGKPVQVTGDDGSQMRVSWSGSFPDSMTLEADEEIIMTATFSRQGAQLLAEIEEAEFDGRLRLVMTLDAEGRVTEAQELEYEEGEWVTMATETYVWEGRNIVRSQTVMNTGGRAPRIWMNLYTFDDNPNAFGGQAYGMVMLASGAIGEGFAGYGSANNLIAYRQRNLEAPVDIRDEAAALAAPGGAWEDTTFDVTYDDHGHIQRLRDRVYGTTRDFVWRCD